MVNQNTFICKIIEVTKTPTRYLIDKCHFNWLIIYKTLVRIIRSINNSFMQVFGYLKGENPWDGGGTGIFGSYGHKTKF